MASEYLGSYKISEDVEISIVKKSKGYEVGFHLKSKGYLGKISLEKS